MANKRAQTGRTSAQSVGVLLVAPESGLPNAADETQRIVNLLRPQVLLGSVTTSDVLDAAQSGDYDVVWFLGHSGPDGLQLSDGVLSPVHLAQILRQSPPRLVVLNSCSSFAVANQLHDALQCAVICTVIDVADIDAYITGAALAHALAQGLDISQAYTASRPPSNRVYVLLNGSLAMNGADKLDDIQRLVTRTAADLHGEVVALRAEMADMRRALEGVQHEQERVRVELATAAERYQPRSTAARALSWLAGALLMIMAAATIDFRDALELPQAAAIAMAAFISLVALWLAVWGLGFRLDRW